MPPAPPKQLVHPGAAIRPDRRTAPHINRFTFVIEVITTSPERPVLAGLSSNRVTGARAGGSQVGNEQTLAHNFMS